jgi:hypothetical protein
MMTVSAATNFQEADGWRERNTPHEAPEHTEVEQVHTIRMQEFGINPEALSCYWHCCSHPGYVIVVTIAIAAAVREALPIAYTAPFPTKGATGLASNSQAWLRESRLQSPRHCSLGQRWRRSADLRCQWREGPTESMHVQACLAAVRVPIGG